MYGSSSLKHYALKAIFLVLEENQCFIFIHMQFSELPLDGGNRLANKKTFFSSFFYVLLVMLNLSNCRENVPAIKTNILLCA